MANQVILRSWRKEDSGPLAAIANNRNIWLNVRDRFPHPYMVQDALAWIDACGKQQPAQNFAIEFGGALVGSAGLIQKEDVYRKSIEIGYFIGEPYWGKGIATAAVAHLMQHIATHYSVVRVYAEVFEHNQASMKVLEKNGFHLEGVREKAVFKNNLLLDDYVWVKLLV